MSPRLFPFAIILAALSGPVSATDIPDSKDVFGIWEMPGGTTRVEIKDCGDGTPCGQVLSVKGFQAQSDWDDKGSASPITPQALVGSEMLWGFKEKSDKWSGGRFFDVQCDREFKSKIERQADGTLRVKGCKGPMCKVQFWSKVQPN